MPVLCTTRFTKTRTSATINIMFLIIMMLFTLFSTPLDAAIKSDDCFECHDAFKKFNHGKVSCVDCHKDVTSLPHEEKLAKPLCIQCHKDIAALYNTSIHSAKKLSCKECHAVHFLDKGKKDCLSCHKEVAHRSMPSKEKHIASLGCTACHGKVKRGSAKAELRVLVRKGSAIGKEAIDPDKNSVIDHAELDRFLAYLEKNHTGSYAVSRSYLVAGDAHGVGKKALQCVECHGDKNIFKEARFRVSGVSSHTFRADPKILIPELPSIKEYKTTVHGKKGVACFDCHISQERISDTTCLKCHKEVYGVYKNSVHTKKGAAQCTDCHDPHSIIAYQEYNAKQRIGVCARCHKDYLEKHSWLPHTRLHFNYLECSTCHSPESQKSIVFYLGKRTNGKKHALTYRDIRNAYGGHVNLKNIIDADSDNAVVSQELSNLFLELQRKFQEELFIGSSIIVTKVHHDYSEKGTKHKACTTCHSSHAPFYDSMYLILPDAEDQLYIPVKGTILGAAPISVFTDLSLLGEERVTLDDIKMLLGFRGKDRSGQAQELGFKWIDILGIAFCAVILIFVMLHIIARIFLKR
jgi:predicted CXXCH cytochrome family protein